MQNRLSIVLADDHTILREGLRALLEADSNFEIVGEARDGREAVRCVEKLGPDLLLMDEPFSALDAPIRIDLQNVMTEFHRQAKLTSITVTHDIEEAVFLGRKILVLGGSCNQNPHTIDNQLAGRIEARNSHCFQKQCEELRSLLGRIS